MDRTEMTLQELRTGVDAALERAEARLSHVQRQLAGWPVPCLLPTGGDDDSKSGWDKLQEHIEELGNGFDSELVAVHEELAQFLQEVKEIRDALA